MAFVYLRPKNKEKKYKIPYQFIKRCTALKDSPKDDIIDLQIIKIERLAESKDAIHFYINDDLLNYIEEYFSLWTDEKSDITSSQIDLEHYTREEPIETGDISKLLVKKDIQFIEKFLEEYRKVAIEKKYIILDEKNKSLNYKTIIDIAILSMLITQANDYLGIESLGNKIFIYIAALLWNKNDSDVAEISSVLYEKSTENSN